MAGGKGLPTKIFRAAIFFWKARIGSFNSKYIPFAAVAIGAGAPPLMVAVCFAIFSNFMWGITEYAGGPGPIYFGQGFFERPRFYKINFILVTVSVLIVFTIGMLWWKLIGLY